MSAHPSWLYPTALPLSAAALLLAYAVPASAATVRQQVLAEYGAAKNDAQRLESLAAGYGYVGWLERSARGGQRRIVLRHGATTRRGAWMTGNVGLGLGRRTDERTGRSVVRVVLSRKPAAGEPTTTLLDPATLKTAKTRWAPLPTSVFRESDSTAEDARILSVSTEPELNAPPERLGGGHAAPTLCRFALEPGPEVVPDRPDCGVPRISLRAGMLALTSQVPSQSGDGSDRGQSYTSALDVYSLTDPGRGWQRVATNVGAYEGDKGWQRYCLADGGAVVVEGVVLELADENPADWTMRYVPADPSVAGWTAPAPFLSRNPSGSHPSQIACDGTKIYALSSRVVGTGTRAKVKTRIARLVVQR